MSTDPVTTYVVDRITIPTGMLQSEFRSRFEDAVPPLPLRSGKGTGKSKARHGAKWWISSSEQRHGVSSFIGPTTSIESFASPGIRTRQSPISWETTSSWRRMFRHQPAVVMYAPLHVAIWSHSDGQAYFTIDKPSDQFGSFSDPRVTAVGYELDAKLAALLKHLQLKVPNTLAQEVPPRLHGH